MKMLFDDLTIRDLLAADAEAVLVLMICCDKNECGEAEYE